MSIGIKIKGKLVTELSQIHGAQKAKNGSNPLIVIKKQKMIVNNKSGHKKIVEIPYYSGNGFRGKLRRACLENILNAIIEKKIPMMSVADFNLMNAGGGNDFQAQQPKVAAMVRDLNPLISVFGASLAISGKLVTPNLIPYANIEDEESQSHYLFEDSDGNLRSSIITTETFIKMDDILDSKGNAKFLSEEQTAKWIERVEENSKSRAEKRKKEQDGDNDEKVKKASIKSINDREFIIRGTDLYTGISESSPLNSIERGMIFKGIESVSLQNLGSNASRDFGKINYTINFDEESELETNVNHFLKAEITKRNYSDAVNEDIKNYENWLNEITEENFKIAELMK